jgi:uncharacterized protein (DUF736 family)
MATIGTFTANSKGEIAGVIKTLTLNTKASFRAVEKEGEKSPDFRVSAADMDIGAAWKKTSREGRDYISVKLDDPSFSANTPSSGRAERPTRPARRRGASLRRQAGHSDLPLS